MPEYRTNLLLKKREKISKINIVNITYLNQHIDIEITHGSKNHVIVRGIANITFNIEVQSTNIVCSIVKNLVMKKGQTLGSKETDIINNTDIYISDKGLYLSEKERKEKVLQGIQSLNCLKSQVGAKKIDGTAIAVMT